MSFDEVMAQPGAVRVLSDLVAREKLGSAYLFEGPSGVGKRLAALSVAQAFLCKDKPGVGCGRCHACERVRLGTHPDARVFAPRDEGHRNIAVEFLREEILPVAQFAPFEGPRAALIFPEADVSFPALHAEGANALLKTLEEPRARVHFFLLAERPDRLLPTIRSRCQRIRFHRLPSAVVARLLERAGVDEATRAVCVALAGGSADRALALASSGKAGELGELALRVDQALALGRPGTLADVADGITRTENVEMSLLTLMAFYRDVARAALGRSTSELTLTPHATEIRERAAQLSPARASGRVERILRTLHTLERNANPQIAVDALLYDLRGI